MISAYAPQVGLSESTKIQFWEDLDSMVSTVPTIVLKALRRGTASDSVGMARRRLGGRLGEQGDAL